MSFEDVLKTNKTLSRLYLDRLFVFINLFQSFSWQENNVDKLLMVRLKTMLGLNDTSDFLRLGSTKIYIHEVNYLA